MPLPIVGGLASAIFYFFAVRFGIKVAKTLVLGGVKLATWSVVIIVFSFLISGVSTAITIIENILSLLTNLNADTSAYNIGASINEGFHCAGVWNGFTTALPIFFGSIIFTLTVILYSLMMSIKDRIEKDVTDLLKLI